MNPNITYRKLLRDLEIRNAREKELVKIAILAEQDRLKNLLCDDCWKGIE